MKNNNHYSYYRLEFYRRCPRFYREHYKAKTPVEDSEMMIDGRVAHDIMRAYAQACHTAKKTQLFGKWQVIAEPLLRQHHIGAHQEDRILKVIEAFVQGNEIELEGLAGIEEELALGADLKPCKWNNGWMRAKLDMLYLRPGQCKVRDYKTGYAMKSDHFQLELYAWMISKIYPKIKRYELEFDFVRFSYQDRWEIQAKDLPAIERKVMNQIARIEADKDFLPKVGSHCANCGYWQGCPAMKQNKELCAGVPRSMDQASKLLGQVVAADKRVRELRAILARYVEEHGRVTANDMEADVKASKRVKWDVPALLEWANREGKMVIDAVTVDNRKLERILGKERPPRSLCTIKIDTDVEIKKISGQAPAKKA